MRIDAIPATYTNPLARDYVNGDPRAIARFAGSPWEESTWKSRLSYMANKKMHADREQLADVLASYNQAIGAHPNVLEQIELLRRPETLVVIGGQQSGLFTGPLLVIYKAITVIRQAREAAKRYDRPVVPLFWIAGEDHDLAEVDHVHLLQSDLQLRKLQLHGLEHDRQSISDLPIPEGSWEQAIRELATELPDTELKAELLRKLTSLCSDANTLSIAFARIMAWLFGEEGLVLIDSADPAVRQLETPMWHKLIMMNDPLRDAYEQGKTNLDSNGYPQQADVHPDGANLFYYHEGKRLLLYRDGDNFVDKQGIVSLSREQLLQIAEQEPHLLSNNVLTRPLMQDFLFPVLAVVLGPGEIAYWAQLKEAFTVLEMEMPVIIPREGYTLLEPIDQKTLAKHEMTVLDALHELDQRRNQWLESQVPFDIDAEIAEVEASIRRLYEPLIDKAGEINQVMRELGQANLKRIVDQVTYYRNRLHREVESKHEVGLRQFTRLQASLLPNGIPQERVYNVFAYLNRYGHHWIHHILHGHRPVSDHGRNHYVLHM